MVRPLPRTEETPTGRVSARIGKFSRVIMMLEFNVKVFESCLPSSQQINEYTYWRDAKKEDVVQMRIFEGGA